MSSITDTAPATSRNRRLDIRTFLQRFGTAGIFIILVVSVTTVRTRGSIIK